MFEFFEIKNKAEYNPLLLAENAPFTQAWFFGEWQEKMGRKVRRFKIKKDSEIIGVFQIIKYPLPFSKSFLYIPHGPVLTSNTQQATSNNEFLKEFHEKLLKIAKEENAIFVRFDFHSRNSDYGSKESYKSYFKKVPVYAYHSSYFQPKFEWILNLEKPEEEILNKMHPKIRYGIRLAENKGVRVEIIKTDFQKYFPDFYNLMKKTAERNKFSLHPEVYYKNIFTNCEGNKNAFLAIANYNNKILAINLILLYGEAASFIFGASSDEYKNLMATYLLHWKIIVEVKKLELKIYNFGAVGENFEGISRFKKRFGGELLEYSDSYDLILKPFWYYLYNLRKLLKR
ncbi:MAG: peptidoglycan bridge formation glycyltransferase FemA/FemB family protein [Parcubacteria group bacterium]|nr:peptidoglycan bridge formation glycyltransferase FemA/FemB family protein [Parcubacteria group bacterium]